MFSSFAIYLSLASILFAFGAAVPTHQCLPPACNPHQLDGYAVRSLSVRGPTPLCHSNAECLSKGLPLLKPSRTSGRALRARASAGPILTGALGVYAADGVTFKGYVAADFSATYYADLVSDYSQALIVSLQSNVQGTTATIRSDQQPAGYPYLCATADSSTTGGTGTMTATNNAYAWISACTIKIEGGPTGSSAVNAYATGSTDNSFYSQTGLFNVNYATDDIAGSWTNPDGSVLPTTFYQTYYTGFSVNPTAGENSDSSRSIIKLVQSAP